MRQPTNNLAKKKEPEKETPLSAVLEVVREQAARLAEIGDLLQFADSEWDDSRQQANQRIAQESFARQRLFERIQRFRRLRAASRVANQEQAGGLSRLQEENEEILNRLEESVVMLERTRDRMRQAESDHRRETEDLIVELDLQCEENSKLQRDCDTLRALLESVPAQTGESGVSIEELEQALEQLQEEQARSRELESLNENLAAQIAELRVKNDTHSQGMSRPAESMTWEERKAAILEQLHREDSDVRYSPKEKVALHELVEKTDREIGRRDEEISELRQLLEQQSTTIQGQQDGDAAVAVGAAAFAQMFDTDEVIREEREKLKSIQLEWQEKLRKAEIELSLERAKMARERHELAQKQADMDEKLYRLAKEQPAVDEATASSAAPKRRWLSQLGLGDGN
jgi:hypothetical protein